MLISCSTQNTKKTVETPEPLPAIPKVKSDEFNRSTIADVTAEFKDLTQFDDKIVPDESTAERMSNITLDNWQYEIPVIYSGYIRPIAEYKRGCISAWAEIRGILFNTSIIYHNEILISEDENKYWLPIQSELIPFLKTEVAAGDTMLIGITVVAAANDVPEEMWIFLIDAFTSLEENPAAAVSD